MKLFILNHLFNCVVCLFRELNETNNTNLGRIMKMFQVFGSFAYFYMIIFAIRINFAWNSMLYMDLEDIVESFDDNTHTMKMV